MDSNLVEDVQLVQICSIPGLIAKFERIVHSVDEFFLTELAICILEAVLDGFELFC